MPVLKVMTKLGIFEVPDSLNQPTIATLFARIFFAKHHNSETLISGFMISNLHGDDYIIM